MIKPTTLAPILVMVTTLVLNADDDQDTSPLHALFDAEWERTMRENPEWASRLGDRRYNKLWGNLSLEAFERSHQADRLVLRQLDEIDVDALTPEDRLNYRLFRQEYEVRVAAYPYGWHLIPLTQRGGIQNAGSLADSLRFDSLQDYEDWLGRMRAFPGFVDQTITLMREGMRQGLVHPRVIMQRVPSQIAKQIVEDPRRQLFFKPFRRIDDTIPQSDQSRLHAEAEAVVRQEILPAYRAFQTFFNEEYLPACYDKVGVWQVPRGDELYVLRCRQFTTTDLSPQQIHETGLREVARIRRAMEDIIQEVQFDGSFDDFLEYLRTDEQFYFENGDDLLQAYLTVSKKIDPQLVKLFKRLPRMPYGVEPIPDYIAPDTTTAYYRPPAADGTRAGTYFVNLYRPEVRPKYEMEALSLHEAVPGHHLQIALAQELEGLPPFRRYGGYTSFVEGWALYAESLGSDLGLYQDPYSRFGQLTYEMWRAVRLVVDTGMHDMHWTRQEAIDFFARNTAKTLHDIENEIDRYIAWPGQALAYKIGELKIQELRRRAEDRLGEQFDVRDFHDVILRQGAVPLTILEELVNDWLDEQDGATVE